MSVWTVVTVCVELATRVVLVVAVTYVEPVGSTYCGQLLVVVVTRAALSAREVGRSTTVIRACAVSPETLLVPASAKRSVCTPGQSGVDADPDERKREVKL